MAENQPPASLDQQVLDFESPDGRVVGIPSDPTSYNLAVMNGYKPLSKEDLAQRDLQQQYGDVRHQIATAASSALSALTFGASDEAQVRSGLVSSQELAAEEQANPKAHFVGTVAGLAVPALLSDGASLALDGAEAAEAGTAASRIGNLLPPNVVAKGAEAVSEAVRSALPAGESVAARLAKEAAARGLGSAVEGAAYGLGNVVHEDALGNPDLTADHVLSEIGLGALFGGGLGAAGGAGSVATKSVLEHLLGSAGANSTDATFLRWLQRFGAERDFKAIGGIQRDLTRLEKSKGSLDRLYDILRDARSEGYLRGLPTPQKIFDRAADAKDQVGPMMGSLLRDLDAATGAERVEKALDISAFGVRMRQEIIQPMLENPRTRAIGERMQRELFGVAEQNIPGDMSRLLEKPSLEQAQAIKQEVSDKLRGLRGMMDPDSTEYRHALHDYESMLTGHIDDAVQKLGGDSAQWRTLRRKYEIAATVQQIAASGVRREVGNNLIPITTGIAAIAAGGGLGAIPAAVLTYAAREFGSAGLGAAARAIEQRISGRVLSAEERLAAGAASKTEAAAVQGAWAAWEKRVDEAHATAQQAAASAADADATRRVMAQQQVVETKKTLDEAQAQHSVIQSAATEQAKQQSSEWQTAAKLRRAALDARAQTEQTVSRVSALRKTVSDTEAKFAAAKSEMSALEERGRQVAKEFNLAKLAGDESRQRVLKENLQDLAVFKKHAAQRVLDAADELRGVRHSEQQLLNLQQTQRVAHEEAHRIALDAENLATQKIRQAAETAEVKSARDAVRRARLAHESAQRAASDASSNRPRMRWAVSKDGETLLVPLSELPGVVLGDIPASELERVHRTIAKDAAFEPIVIDLNKLSASKGAAQLRVALDSHEPVVAVRLVGDAQTVQFTRASLLNKAGGKVLEKETPSTLLLAEEKEAARLKSMSASDIISSFAQKGTDSDSEQKIMALSALERAKNNQAKRIGKSLTGFLSLGGSAAKNSVTKLALTAADNESADEQRKKFNVLARNVRRVSANPTLQTDVVEQLVDDLPAHAPQSADALRTGIVRRQQWVASNLPPAPLNSPIGTETNPDPLAVQRFMEQFAAVDDPVSLLKSAAGGVLTDAMVRAVADTSPQALRELQSNTMDFVSSHRKDLSAQQIRMLSTLMQTDLDGSIGHMPRSAAMYQRQSLGTSDNYRRRHTAGVPRTSPTSISRMKVSERTQSPIQRSHNR